MTLHDGEFRQIMRMLELKITLRSVHGIFPAGDHECCGGFSETDAQEAPAGYS